MTQSIQGHGNDLLMLAFIDAWVIPERNLHYFRGLFLLHSKSPEFPAGAWNATTRYLRDHARTSELPTYARTSRPPTYARTSGLVTNEWQDASR